MIFAVEYSNLVSMCCFALRQFFVMQMDAHCLFVRHWDSLIIDQWRSTGNEMAVLT